MSSGSDSSTADAGLAVSRHVTESPALAISNGMVGLLSRYTGRGPTSARTIVNANVVVVMLRDTLTKGEHSLVAAGQTNAVRRMRRTFHELMRAEAVALVEAALGRRVIACLADIDPVADVATIVVPLEEQPEPGRLDVAERRGGGRTG